MLSSFYNNIFKIKNFFDKIRHSLIPLVTIGVLHSWLVRSLRVGEVAGSNPVTPISNKDKTLHKHAEFFILGILKFSGIIFIKIYRTYKTAFAYKNFSAFPLNSPF